MATKIIKAWINGVIQEIEVEDITSPEQPLSVEDRLIELEDKPVIVDWNENDETSSSYIKNRPFYEETGIQDFISLTELSFVEYGQNENGETIYSANGSVPDAFASWDTCVVEWLGETIRCYPNMNENGFFYIGNYSLVDQAQENTGETFYFEFTDTYADEEYSLAWNLYTTESSLTEFIVKQEYSLIHQIDEKFLPNSATVQADASEGDPSSPSYIHNLPCREYYGEDYNWIYERAEGTSEISTEVENQVIFPNPDGVMLTEGENHRLSFYCVGEVEETFVEEYDIYPESSTLLEINGVTFEFTSESILVTMDSSVHTFTTNNTYYIMLARKEWMSVVEKLDARFLPDEVMLPSDWSENDPDSPYYINNRTHYIETTSSELCVIDTLEFSEYQTRENGEVIYSSSGTNESLVFDVNKTYVVQWPDSWCGVIPYEYNGMVCVGSEYLYDESAHDSGEGFFITTDGVGGYTAYCLSSDTINGLIIESETTSVQQLDEMFIPDSIARVDDIPSLDGYATEEFVSTAIDELAGGNGATIQYIATITTNWTGDAAPYTQEIAVEGILEGDDPIVDLVLSDDYATSQVQLEEWKKVYRITTSDNLITVYAEESILINLSIQLLVSRDKVIDVGTVGRDSIIDEAVTAQKIAKESRTQYFSAALNVENWVGDVAPYSQTVAVEGLLESDRPKVYLDIPDDFDAVETQQTAFSLLYDVDTADGSVTFKAKDMPSTTFGVTLEVARI